MLESNNKIEEYKKLQSEIESDWQQALHAHIVSEEFPKRIDALMKLRKFCVPDSQAEVCVSTLIQAFSNLEGLAHAAPKPESEPAEPEVEQENENGEPSAEPVGD